MFLRTDALEPGMVLSTQDGDGVTVINVDKTNQTAPTYNLTVEDAHTFFVGDDGIWVHNVNNCLDVDGSGNTVGFKDPEVQNLYNNSSVRSEFTPEEFAELAFDLDKGKISPGSVAELEAVTAAKRQGLIKGDIKQAETPGADFSSSLGEHVDIKAPVEGIPFFKERRDLLKFVGRLESNPDTRIVFDPTECK